MPVLRQMAAAIVVLAAACSPAHAQGPAYPSQVVRLVVPFSPGSMTDILARAVGDKLATRWSQQVIIENRPGLAVTGGKRLAALPDVPTFKEAGLPEFIYDAWFGIMAPAGTPQPIIDKVGADVAEALGSADMRSRFGPLGVDLASSKPGAFADVIRADTERFAKVLPAKPAN